MIHFTDKRLYVKGTCNVVLEDIDTGDVLYQSNKMATGDISATVEQDEIRAGLGNPVAAFLPTSSDLQVSFTAADFNLWMKAAELGTSTTYSAPVPHCQIVTAESSALAIDVTEYTPVAEIGKSEAYCYVQEVGEASPIATDGTAYSIAEDGSIADYTAVEGTTYKIWYFIQKPAAQKAVISSVIDPKVVRFTAQIAVFANKSSNSYGGTRVGWLYYTIPYLKLQGNAVFTGDQNNNDTTAITGKAVAYDTSVYATTCEECEETVLGYIVYSPDSDVDDIQGLAVIGGVITLQEYESVPIQLYFVMNDGSLARATNMTAFTYTLASGGDTYATVSSNGIVTGVSEGETELTISYTDEDGNTYRFLRRPL